MKKNRRPNRGFLLKIILLSLLCVIFLSGCFQAPQQGQPGGEAPAVVTVWYSLQGAEANAFNNQVQNIMKSHPEVLIKPVYIPENKIVSMAFQAEAGGEGPELFIARRSIIRQLYAQGSLAPDVTNSTDAFSALQAEFRFAGKKYASPWLTDVPVLYYRKDGAGAPANLADLFSKGGPVVAALNTQTLAALWSGQGGALWAPATSGKAGGALLNSPANLSFLQQLLNWRDLYQLQVNPNALTLFTGGQAKYMIGWASQAAALTQAKIPWGSMDLTALQNGLGKILPGETLGIANSAIKTTSAMSQPIRIVEEALLNPSVEGALTNVSHQFPASIQFYNGKDAQQGIYPQVSSILNKAWDLEGSAPEWILMPLQDNAWASAFAGTMNPQEALNNAQNLGVKALGK